MGRICAGRQCPVENALNRTKCRHLFTGPSEHEVRDARAFGERSRTCGAIVEHTEKNKKKLLLMLPSMIWANK